MGVARSFVRITFSVESYCEQPDAVQARPHYVWQAAMLPVASYDAANGSCARAPLRRTLLTGSRFFRYDISPQPGVCSPAHSRFKFARQTHVLQCITGGLCWRAAVVS